YLNHCSDASPPRIQVFPSLSHHTSPAALYSLSLHDALPIYQVAVAVGAVDATHRRPHLRPVGGAQRVAGLLAAVRMGPVLGEQADRKSTRLNSSHVSISYAVFCLKKKKR